jgi:hypothetical protein
MRSIKLGPTEVGSLYEVILAGDSDDARRGDRSAVVVSDCEYRFRDDDNLEKCISLLQQSDERLGANPNRLYDWNKTMISRYADGGGVIVFSVSWYDEDFFARRRDVFKNDLHGRINELFDISENDISVTHWRHA